ncbi:Glutathione-dependent formaldehyde-activating enzyme [compost metagenome]
MNANLHKRGSCLCGAVKFSINLKHPAFGACHCSMCRKWGGGPLLTVDSDAPAQYSQGEDQIRTFSSSEWAERGFCATCGSHLFYRLKQGGFYAVPVGLIEEADDLTFGLQVFIDEKPASYCFSNQTETMTGQQVAEMFDQT